MRLIYIMLMLCCIGSGFTNTLNGICVKDCEATYQEQCQQLATSQKEYYNCIQTYIVCLRDKEKNCSHLKKLMNKLLQAVQAMMAKQ